MKKILCTIVCVCLIFISCSKEGPMGPEGEQGPQGEQGVAGMDGTFLLSGDGIPGNATGKNGDFYLDKSNLNLYGPKTNAGWGEGTSIKGKDGEDGKDGANGKDGKDGTNGKDGAKILSGTEVPTSQLGTIGDFYFDIQNLSIYGPKTSAGWGAPVSLKAPNSLDVTLLLYRNHSFQKITADGSDYHDMESIILIDDRFHEVYDNGITLVQIRRAGAHWTTEIYVEDYGINERFLAVFLIGEDYDDEELEVSIQKERIKLYGYAFNYTRAELEALKFDIKILFIPATTVIEMKAKNIDITNATDMTKYLEPLTSKLF